MNIKEEVELYCRRMPTPPPRQEVEAFTLLCERTGLSPIARQIYLLPRRGKSGTTWSTLTSIDGIRVSAHRSEKYLGQAGPFWCGPDGKWVDVWLSDKPPAAAKVGVYLKGAEEPTWAVANWESYYPGDGPQGQMWRKFHYLMLAKCAEALALRKALPAEMQGLYTAEEMAQAKVSIPEPQPEVPDVTPIVTKFAQRIRECESLAELQVVGADIRGGNLGDNIKMELSVLYQEKKASLQ